MVDVIDEIEFHIVVNLIPHTVVLSLVNDGWEVYFAVIFLGFDISTLDCVHSVRQVSLGGYAHAAHNVRLGEREVANAVVRSR